MRAALKGKRKEHLAEIARVREIASNFKALIEMKQSEYEAMDADYDMKSLIAGTKYEKVVFFKNSQVEYVSKMSVYRWMFIERSGNDPALLLETRGFDGQG